MPERLHQLDHIYLRQPIYFITACTHERQPLLANAPTHEAFLAFARAAYERGVAVGRYVLMPDHLHLFASFAPDALSLSDWMKALKGSLAKLWREQGCSGGLRPCSGGLRPCSGGLRPPVVDQERFGGRRPPLQKTPGGRRPPLQKTPGGRRPPLQTYWQKGFFDHVIRSSESYSEKWAYVLENPVRKTLVARAAEWPYQGEVQVLRPEESTTTITTTGGRRPPLQR